MFEENEDGYFIRFESHVCYWMTILLLFSLNFPILAGLYFVICISMTCDQQEEATKYDYDQPETWDSFMHREMFHQYELDARNTYPLMHADLIYLIEGVVNFETIPVDETFTRQCYARLDNFIQINDNTFKDTYNGGLATDELGFKLGTVKTEYDELIQNQSIHEEEKPVEYAFADDAAKNKILLTDLFSLRFKVNHEKYVTDIAALSEGFFTKRMRKKVQLKGSYDIRLDAVYNDYTLKSFLTSGVFFVSDFEFGKFQLSFRDANKEQNQYRDHGAFYGGPGIHTVEFDELGGARRGNYLYDVMKDKIITPKEGKIKG